MFVKITEGSQGAWWEHRTGEVFEVREPKIDETMFKGTHYMLVNEIPGNRNAVAISKKACVVLDEIMTNKQAVSLLSKEEM